MLNVTLIVHTAAGAREVTLEGERLSIGSGESAALLIEDDGLAALHASVHRQGERVWVLEETPEAVCHVNGARVAASGTPLRDGDEITLSDDTALTVHLRAESSAPSSQSSANGGRDGARYLHAAVIAVLVTLLSALVFDAFAPGAHEQPPAAQNPDPPPLAHATASVSNRSDAPEDYFARPLFEDSSPDASNVSGVKLYAAMDEGERSDFVAREARRVARRIGNRDGHDFTPEALRRIKHNVDAYASRARLAPTGGCRFGQSLGTTLERARQSAPFINRSFNEKGLSPVVGLYLAMIESEYCPCMTSPTGPKGMFQFTRATARAYGLQVVEPEERCVPEKAAPAAALYMKALIGRYGTGPLSVPLAVASYNSGEGDLSRNLFTALDAVRRSENPERSFWTLVASEEMLTDQFQRENIKYVPKFFAAAIVGENPRVFGVALEPLSTYDH